MVRWFDVICYFFAIIIFIVLMSTIVVAYLDYFKLHQEYKEEADRHKDFFKTYCLDSKELSKHPQLKESCHNSQHAIYDDPKLTALRDVLMRWSICDLNGCEKILESFESYSLFLIVSLAIIVGGWATLTARKISIRKDNNSLPSALRKKQS